MIEWISGFFLILVVLFVLYLRGTFHRKVKYRMKDIPSFNDPHFPLAMMGVSASLIASGNVENFWDEIDGIYAARLEAIRRARRTIHFETFFMTPGRRGDEFADGIIERSQAGVEVLLIVDSLGASSMPKQYWQRLRAGGVNVRFFHPLTWKYPLNFNNRTHRKLMLIDGKIAFVGGMGVSDRWDGMPKAGDTEPWLDCEVSFTGPIVAILEGIFMQHWLYVGGVASLSQEIFHPSQDGSTTVIVTPSDNPTDSSPVCALFYTSIRAAKKRIWLASPYFLPDKNSRSALVNAKKNGVDVRILTVGPHNDKKLVYYGVRERYRDLLAAGIEINEYQPSMMHAKVLLIDDAFVSTGSTNLDPRSLFLNDELHLSLVEPKLANLVEEFFVGGFKKSDRISLQQWKKRHWWQSLLGQFVLFFRWQL
ncbi:MAG TPA: cardiolipin synthase B [Cyanobacteria bacterium UBA11372]|nr:cardiolipin synthase B [Cyanobacteria bacterium UBA11372]